MKYKELIEKLSQSYNLSGGNCGTFSCAFAQSQLHLNPEILIITDSDEEEDLFYGEPNIYHVVTKIDNMYYDADGIHRDLESIADWVEEEYDPSNLESFSFSAEEWNTPKFFTMIRSNTNYSIEIVEFLSKIRKLNNKKSA